MSSKNIPIRKKRRLAVQSLECRRVLAASLGWDGPGLGSAELTYYIANSPNSLSQAETNAAIATALNAWSSAADITFTPTNQPGLRDSIDISFVNIDGTAGTLAQAYFPDDVNSPRIAGDIQFDISEAWEVGNSLASRAFDLVSIAVHEIGHSLGLDHSQTRNSVLASSVSANESFAGLSAEDVAAIQGLYAAADGDAPSTPSTTSPSTDPISDADDNGDADDNPFPRNRWRRGGHWHRFGGRLDAERTFRNYVNPTDVNDDNQTSAADALMVINQLNRLSSGDASVDTELAGLCDTNGDGDVTAADALAVINTLNIASLASSNTSGDGDSETDLYIAVDVEDTDEDSTIVNDVEAPVDEVDDTSTSENEANDPDSTVLDEDGTVVSVDDEAAEDSVTTVGEDDSIDSDDDSVDSGEDDDAVDPVDETVDDTIDDGGLIDDTDDSTPEESDDHTCRDGTHHRRHVFGGLFGKSTERLLSRFDTDDNDSLSQSEVSSKLWDKLTELNVDSDADGLITLNELNAAILAIRQDAFDKKDTDADGKLTESEVRERVWIKISEANTNSDAGVSFDELITFLNARETAVVERDPRVQHERKVDSVFAQLGADRAPRTRGRR